VPDELRRSYRSTGDRLLPQLRQTDVPAVYARSAGRALLRAVPERPGFERADTCIEARRESGVVPGLGAVYNGQYAKALVHLLIFAGLISLIDADIAGGLDAAAGIALACFIFYMPIEAYRTAKARLMGTPEPEGMINVDSTSAKPIGAIVLIGMGVLLLMRNFDFLNREWFQKTWPIALIGFGVWLAWDRFKKPS
jgi:cell wall-active antibiotic response 4TMS protein YvqF